jgi:hypothetical protein
MYLHIHKKWPFDCILNQSCEYILIFTHAILVLFSVTEIGEFVGLSIYMPTSSIQALRQWSCILKLLKISRFIIVSLRGWKS